MFKYFIILSNFNFMSIKYVVYYLHFIEVDIKERLNNLPWLVGGKTRI